VTIPKIQPYEIPSVGDVNRVAWNPDPAHAVLLVHDMQNHFVQRYEPGTSPIAPATANIARLADRARELGVPVVYTGKNGGHTPAERGLELEFWGPGMPADSHAEAIIDELDPQVGDFKLVKWKYSAFVGSSLGRILKGRSQLIITGIYAHIGVRLTASDAFMRDIRPFVVSDAVADFSERQHTEALEWVAGCCGVVSTTDEVLKSFQESK
jgi:bifunctional isochorismate lyase/aryl carrier protein